MNRKIASKLLSLISFLYIGFILGFALGTLTLVVIIKPILPSIRMAGFSYGVETFVAVFFIFLYAILTLYVTINFYYWLKISRSHLARIFLLIIITIPFIASLTFWLNPSPKKNYIYSVSEDGRFAVGSYPDLKTMIKLKKQGYTSIISLLNAVVVPFEPYLINKETNNAKLAGIELIEIPMLPWISSNEEALKKIELIASELDNKKYYIHCYFGEDRVLVAKNIISQYTSFKDLATQSNAKKPKKLEFGRGKGIWLDAHTLLVPRLSSMQNLLYAINNFDIKTVVSLNENKAAFDPTQVLQELLSSKYSVKFISMPLASYPYDPFLALQITKKIKKLSPQVLVYDVYMPPYSILAEGFAASYKSDLPAIPKSLIKKILATGSYKIPSPNTIIGAPPSADKIKELINIGIRNFVNIGQCSYFKRPNIKASTQKISFQCLRKIDKGLLEKIKKGGTWYIYSTNFEDILI